MVIKAECGSCQGTGAVLPSSPFGMPLECFRCRGEGQIDWDDIRPGEHVCYFYNDNHEQLHNVAVFLAAGIKNRERCASIEGVHSAEQVVEAMESYGINAKKACENGQLVFMSKEDVYLVNGVFDAQRIIKQFKEYALQAVAEGFKGLRVTADGGWALNLFSRIEEFLDYELQVKDFFLAEGQNITALCQYPRYRCSKVVRQGVRQSHPLVFQD